MRVVFESSHVTDDYRNGRLTVAIGAEDEARGQTSWESIYFEVPPDFHTHNDAVAAALMTLVGRRYQEVELNFPISPFCAETLRAYYGEIAIGPVDPSRAPRRPGRRVGLNFSGGIDSTAVWLLLRELYGDDFAVITSEYGGFSAFEAEGFGAYHRDVSCRTDLRARRFDREGRFHFCVPLLFADYLDLGAITTGHPMSHTLGDLADYRDGRRPPFLAGDLVVNAGGLEDLHILRSLFPIGIARIIMTLGRDRIAGAIAASSPRSSIKPYATTLIFRHFFADAGLPSPPFLDQPPPFRRPLSSSPFRLLYLIKRDGIARTSRYVTDLDRFDPAFFSGLTLRFLERYNPVYIDLLAEPLRSAVIDLYRRCGIEPWDDRDWDELKTVLAFFKANLPMFHDLPT